MILDLVWAGLLGILLAQGVWAWYHSEGTGWERLKATFKSSLTIAWTRLNALSVLLTGAIGEVAMLAGAPGIKDAIAPWLAPQYMAAYTVFVLVGAELARRRTLP